MSAWRATNCLEASVRLRQFVIDAWSWLNYKPLMADAGRPGATLMVAELFRRDAAVAERFESGSALLTVGAT